MIYCCNLRHKTHRTLRHQHVFHMHAQGDFSGVGLFLSLSRLLRGGRLRLQWRCVRLGPTLRVLCCRRQCQHNFSRERRRETRKETRQHREKVAIDVTFSSVALPLSWSYNAHQNISSAGPALVLAGCRLPQHIHETILYGNTTERQARHPGLPWTRSTVGREPPPPGRCTTPSPSPHPRSPPQSSSAAYLLASRLFSLLLSG